MALTDPDNTLAYHQSRSFTSMIDRSTTPCSKIAQALVGYKTDSKATPEMEAVEFYAMNHAMALISAERAPLEPLPAVELALVKSYHEDMTPKAVRAFRYLTLICIREFRHCNSISKDLPKIADKFGPVVGDWVGKAKQGDEDGIADRFIAYPPATDIATLMRAIRWGFYNGIWSSGYGGKAWGRVTDCLVRFITGEYSAEMMVDTVWTLSHNNGPIFNKGRLYNMHTDKLVRLLDIQRSGQVLEAVRADPAMGPYITPKFKALLGDVDKLFPGAVGKFVDWEVVEALGSVNKYPNEKKAQHALHGETPAAKAAKAAALIQAEQAAKAAQAAKEEHDAKYFVVMPGVTVEKLQRAA